MEQIYCIRASWERHVGKCSYSTGSSYTVGKSSLARQVHFMENPAAKPEHAIQHNRSVLPPQQTAETLCYGKHGTAWHIQRASLCGPQGSLQWCASETECCFLLPGHDGNTCPPGQWWTEGWSMRRSTHANLPPLVGACSASETMLTPPTPSSRTPGITTSYTVLQLSSAAEPRLPVSSLLLSTFELGEAPFVSSLFGGG